MWDVCSGKTHNALVRLAQAQSGVYCGPLRLLAEEVFRRMNSEGVACSLTTGQRVVTNPAARHLSCTVEMADTARCLFLTPSSSTSKPGSD